MRSTKVYGGRRASRAEVAAEGFHVPAEVAAEGFHVPAEVARGRRKSPHARREGYRTKRGEFSDPPPPKKRNVGNLTPYSHGAGDVY